MIIWRKHIAFVTKEHSLLISTALTAVFFIEKLYKKNKIAQDTKKKKNCKD